MSKSQLNLESEQHGESLVIRPVGVIDASNMDRFQKMMEEMCRKESPRLVLDCHDLSYMNSSSFGLLFHFHRLCESHNGDFRICRVPHKIDSVIRILGLHSILYIHKSLEDALARQSGPA